MRLNPLTRDKDVDLAGFVFSCRAIAAYSPDTEYPIPEGILRRHDGEFVIAP